MPRALLVLPLMNFAAKHYSRTRELLEQEGFEVQVATPRPITIDRPGLRLKTDLEIHQVTAAHYDLVVFVGTYGRELWDDPEAQRVARDAATAGRVIGAGGAAVGILANAGILAGRHVTGPLPLRRFLEAKGAEFSPGPVTMDRGLVTARKVGAFASFVHHLIGQVRDRTRLGEAA